MTYNFSLRQPFLLFYYYNAHKDLNNFYEIPIIFNTFWTSLIFMKFLMFSRAFQQDVNNFNNILTTFTTFPINCAKLSGRKIINFTPFPSQCQNYNFSGIFFFKFWRSCVILSSFLKIFKCPNYETTQEKIYCLSTQHSEG